MTRCAAGTPVDVTVSAPDGTEVDVDGQGPRTSAFTAKVSLAAGQGFRIVVTSGAPTATYYVRCLPSDYPRWTFQRTGQPEAEWYAIVPIGRTDFQPVPPGISLSDASLFDANGVPVWWTKAPLPPTFFRVFPNGNVGWVRGDTGGQERRLDGSFVRTITAVGGQTDPHEFILLPSGNYLLTVARTISGMTPCGQSGRAQIYDNGAQEIRPDGSLVWEWWASEHVADAEIPSVWCSAKIQGGAYDPYHINSIEPDGAGAIMSFRHLDAVYRVTTTTGNVTWKLGGGARPESLTILNDPVATAGGAFRGQHDARVLPDGTLTVHDNGFYQSAPRPPRAVRYAIDANARTATLVEQKNDPDPIATPVCCGSARRLAGGDWVMAWGSSGLVTELSPSGSRVFSLTFDDSLFSYRAHPVPFGALSRTALRDGMDAQFPRGYARPKGADQLRVPLVPAYRQCLSPDRAHGPPLAFASCNSPAGESSFLTVGTPDANGAAANSTGFLTYTALPGAISTPASEADVRVRVQMSDVRWKSNLSDYAGQLRVRGAVRVTDRLNGSLQNEAATGVDTEFPLTVACAATASTTAGADCSLSSTVNAIVPGAVVEHKRATWQLGKVEVFDGGAGGVAGASGATLFQTQGLFVP